MFRWWGASVARMPAREALRLARDAAPPRPRNATKAAVHLVRLSGGGRAVVKTVRDRPWICRRGPGSWMLRREGRMLARTQHLDVVPRLLADEGDALVLEHVPGPTVSDLRRGGLPPADVDRVRAAVTRLHAAGFAHGDLGRRDIVLRPDGRVVLLDLATLVDGRGARGLRRLLFGFARWKDRRRVDHILHVASVRWERSLEVEPHTPLPHTAAVGV